MNLHVLIFARFRNRCEQSGVRKRIGDMQFFFLTCRGKLLSRRGKLLSYRGKLLSRRGKLLSRRGKLISRRGKLLSRRGKILYCRCEILTLAYMFCTLFEKQIQ
jgi:hypothetical protein